MAKSAGQLWTPGGMRDIPKDEAGLKEVAKVAATMDLQPIHENVLVKRIPDEELSKGGIHLPETARNKMIIRGIVTACGPGRRDAQGQLLPIGVKVGDLVLVSTYAGATEIEVAGEKFSLIREQDILGRFVPKVKLTAPDDGFKPDDSPGDLS